VTTPTSKFIDLSLTLVNNPTTGDIATVKDIDAIKTSLRNILLTRLGERPFEPRFGSRVYDSLFEQLDFITLDALASSVIEAITLWEPRVSITRVEPVARPDENEVEVIIIFSVIGSEYGGPQTFSHTFVISR
jgi:phage baseplate assembly protein W